MGALARRLTAPREAIEVRMEGGELKAGEVFHGYRIVRLIAAGGMGEVYEAVHEFTGRPVALKVLQLRHTTKPEAKARAQAEAVVLCRLNHENIVKVHDANITDHGTVWIAMELLEGGTLRDVIHHQAPLPVAQALYYAIEIADGIVQAHEINVIHRDLKPENVFVTTQHKVKVLDLNAAKFRGFGVKSTERGRTIGTPAYMSPEQIFGEKVDEGTDIYALGLMIYEMLAGKYPFALDGDMPTNRELGPVHLYREVTALPVIAPGVPEHVWTIVRRMLAKQREHRYPSMSEVARELRLARRRWIEASQGGVAAYADVTVRREHEAPHEPPDRWTVPLEPQVVTALPRMGVVDPTPRIGLGDRGTIPMDRPAESGPAEATNATATEVLSVAVVPARTTPEPVAVPAREPLRIPVGDAPPPPTRRRLPSRRAVMGPVLGAAIGLAGAGAIWFGWAMSTRQTDLVPGALTVVVPSSGPVAIEPGVHAEETAQAADAESAAAAASASAAASATAAKGPSSAASLEPQRSAPTSSALPAAAPAPRTTATAASTAGKAPARPPPTVADEEEVEPLRF